MRVVVLALFSSLLVGVAPATVLERIERDSLGRLFLFCSESPPKWSSELSADKHRVVLTLFGSTAAPQVRSRSWSEGLLREAYVQQHGTDLQVYVTAARPTGYTLVWLPYSRCLLLTLVNWDELPPSADLYHSALLALELGSDTVADSLLAEALHRGHSDAAVLAAVRALMNGKPLTALQHIRRASSRSSLPDFYGVVAHLAELGAIPSLQSWASARFHRWTARTLPPLPALAPESLAVLADALLSAPLVDTTAFAIIDTVRRSPLPAPAVSGDTAQGPPTRSATETPEWLLLGGPLLFALLLLFSIGFLIRSLLRAFQRRSSAQASPPENAPSPSPEAFPTYVQQLLLRYRAGEEATVHRLEEPAAAHVAEPSATEPVSPASSTGTAPEKPSMEKAPEPLPSEPPAGLIQLWRQRVQHRSALLRQQLHQLSAETIPASKPARARLARRLRLPQEGLELHWRLHSNPPTDPLVRFRMQAPSSFVSAPETASHSGEPE